MKKLIVVALAAASCVLGSTLASAAYVTDYDQFGNLLGTWTQSLTPTVLFDDATHYTVVAISNGTGAALGYDDAFWYGIPFDHGGLLVGDAATSPINAGGGQTYSGDESAPVFVPGTFIMNDGSVVTIAVPEPATWAMMLVGFGLVGLAARGRRTVRVAYG